MSKVTVIGYDYPPNDGGISRLGAGIVDGLIRHGVETDVITLKAAASEGLARPNCPHREVSRERGLRELATLAQLITRARAHPVIATVWNPEATVAMLAARSRLTVLAHGNELMAFTGKTAKQGLRQKVLSFARLVVCNSAYTETLVRDIAPNARTVIINPAVDASRFQYQKDQAAARAELGLPNEKRVVLSVSRLDAMKGHETVLHALAALPTAQRDQIFYVVAGKGPHALPLSGLTQSLGLGQNVCFLGFVPDHQLPALYASADLFVLCSLEDKARRAVEGFGMVFTEAQSAGLPVIGTRSGGIPDAIRERKGGWLIPERDCEALQNHLLDLVEKPEYYRRQGEAGKRRVQRVHSWDGYIEELLKVI